MKLRQARRALSNKVCTTRFPTTCLLPKQPPHSLEHTILLRIIRMLLTGYLQYSRESIRIRIHPMSDPFRNLKIHKHRHSVLRHGKNQEVLVGRTYMLIDQQNSNVFPIMRIPIKRLLDLGGLGLGIDDEEILLGIRRGGHMLYRELAILALTGRVESVFSLLCLQAVDRSLSPVEGLDLLRFQRSQRPTSSPMTARK